MERTISITLLSKLSYSSRQHVSLLKTIMLTVFLCNVEIVLADDIIFFEGGTYRKISSSEVELCNYYNQESIIIPSTVSEQLSEDSTKLYTVTSIGKQAFYYNWNLEEIILPNTLKSIGEYAFSGTNILSIIIPHSVKEIEANAFAGCEKLRHVTLSNSLVTIKEGLFSNCSSLASITIPQSVKIIESGAFSETALQSIVIPDSVTSIGNGVFSWCNNLSSVKINDGVAFIGSSAFAYCDKLTSIVLPQSVYTIGESAFSHCSSLISFSIPDNVTRIEKATFEGCSQLAYIDISNSVTSIGFHAFKDCVALTSISIPSSVTSFSSGAFEGCNLNDVTLNCEEVLSYFFENNKESITNVTIGENVRKIDYLAFMDFVNLKSLTIENGVKSIGYGAFMNCSSLMSITIPNSVTSIGGTAFYGCTSLASITIPNSVTSIGTSAFEDCSKLTSLTIGNGLIFAEGSICNGCSSLTSLTLHCKEIGTYWFQQQKYIKNIIFGDEVETIGDQAFTGCSGLTTLTIGSGLKSIGGWAFSGCSGIMAIDIPDCVTEIGEYAFANCISLKSITIPDRVTIINEGIFCGCENISGNLVIPHSVEVIGAYAFNGCDSIETVTIGRSIKRIAKGAFPYNLKKVYCYAEAPVEIDPMAFSISIPSATLYIPEASYESYRSAECWNSFFMYKRPLKTLSLKGFSAHEFNPRGITADGLAQMRFYYVPPQTEYSMFDPDLSQAKVRIEIDGEECTDEKMVGKVDDVDWNDGDWGVNYTSPDGFPEDIKEKEYKLQLSLLDQYDGLVGYLGSREIKVVRPGLMLVHGFRDNSSCFHGLYSYLTSVDNDYEDWQVLKVDYSSTNKAGFATNVAIVKDCAYDLYEQLKEHGILSGRYDFVGHSMGGLLARKYAQESNNDGVNRLITVNTPHSGSQIADLVMELGEIAAIIGKRIPNPYVKLAVGALALFVTRSGRYDAFKDLSPSSEAIRELNANTGFENGIPIHAFCSYLTAGEDEEPRGQIVKEKSTNFLGFLVESVSFFVQDVMLHPSQPIGKTILDNILEDNHHDAVVSLTSQRGGLPNGCVTVLSSEFKGWRGEESDAYHSNVVNMGTNINGIAQLLRESKSSAKFSRYGFEPVDLTISSARQQEQKNGLDFNEPSEGQFIKIHVAKADDARIINVGLNYSDDVMSNLVFLRLSDDVILSAGNESSYRFAIPDTYDGTFTVYALGRTSNNALVADTAMVSYESTQMLDSLYFAVDTMSVEVGQRLMVDVTALWSNGEQTSIDPFFTTTDSSKLAIDGINIIGKSEGECLLVASYKGKYDTLSVTVLPRDPASIEKKQLTNDNFNVYTMAGTLVRQQATTLKGLKPGVYIVNRKKIIVR